MVENVKELLKLHEGIAHEVYLDNENSCIVPKEVVDGMLPYFNKTAYGNPTLTHKPGWEAFEVIMNSFHLTVSTPIALAASSSSRIARRNEPMGDFNMMYINSTRLTINIKNK